MDLLGSSSSEDEELSFKINTNYAKSYDKWRKKEEKQKLLDRYGEAESTDSSSEEEEIRSTPQMDKDWLRAYAVVRFKQPRLYKEGERFFKDEAKPISKKKEKATTLKDHERKFILDKGGIESDDDSKPKVSQGKSYFEEQEEIKQSLKEAIGDSSDDDEDEKGGDEDFLVKANKTEEQKQKEENEYLEWIKGERETLGDPEAEAELAPLKQYWNDPSLDEKERVLRDYILNNGYIDQEESDSESDDDDGAGLRVGPDRDEEEKFLQEAEKYEHKYNFRHEEPGGDEIKSFPRVIETSVRTKDTRRAEKRKQKLERKRKEKEKVKDEIRLLQKLQMEEKMEKLEQLRKIADRPDLDYDLDADFDPEKHNQIMKKYFDDDYYEDEDDDKKPTFEYDAAIDEEEDDWWKERLQEEREEAGDDGKEDGVGQDETNTAFEEDEEEPDADDPNFIMDADYDPTHDYKAEKKRAKKYGKALARKLPVFDPTQKTFDEYIDEYLKDKIDDLPFTYRKVVPNDYGLSTEEILSLPDRELNAWVSLKKMSMHRTQKEEMEERRRYQAKSRDLSRKQKLLPSLFKPQGDNPEAKKKKKKRKKRKAEDEDDDENVSDNDNAQTSTSSPARLNPDMPPAKKSKKSASSITSDLDDTIDTHPEDQNDSFRPKKSKKKNVKKGVSEEKESSGSHSNSAHGSDEVKKPKKKKEKEALQQKKNKLKGSGDGAKNDATGGSSTDQPNDSLMAELPKKKKKKTKKGDDGNQLKQKKKKKMSIKMNKKLVDGNDTVTGSKSLERKLGKIMSASRLSKYGLGPKPAMETKKKKKKKKNEGML